MLWAYQTDLSLFDTIEENRLQKGSNGSIEPGRLWKRVILTQYLWKRKTMAKNTRRHILSAQAENHRDHAHTETLAEISEQHIGDCEPEHTCNPGHSDSGFSILEEVCGREADEDRKGKPRILHDARTVCCHRRSNMLFKKERDFIYTENEESYGAIISRQESTAEEWAPILFASQSSFHYDRTHLQKAGDE